jgi:hypothetical protein
MIPLGYQNITIRPLITATGGRRIPRKRNAY